MYISDRLTGIFRPVRLAVHSMKMKAEFLGFTAPVRAIANCYAFHVNQPPIEREDELLLPDERCMVFCFATLSPKPPRVVVVVVAR